MNKLIKDALILTVITLVAGVALGLVEGITREPIARAEEQTTKEAYESLFPDASSFEALEFDADAAIQKAEETVPETVGSDWPSGSVSINALTDALDGSGQSIGKIITVTNKKSYGGSVTLSVGISNEGQITGYKITDISDTPGLGMKATESDFMSRFVNIPASIYKVTKQVPGENEIQAISGATITSRAVINSVDAAVAYYELLNGGDSNESGE